MSFDGIKANIRTVFVLCNIIGINRRIAPSPEIWDFLLYIFPNCNQIVLTVVSNCTINNTLYLNNHVDYMKYVFYFKEQYSYDDIPCFLIIVFASSTYCDLASSCARPFLAFQASHFAFAFNSVIPGCSMLQSPTET